jgi:hypothetical protein
MKAINRAIPGALFLGAALLSPAGAQPAATPSRHESRAAQGSPRDNRNAALYYWRALYTLDRDFQKEASDLLVPDRAADWVPSDSTMAKLDANSGFIEQLLQASRIDKCDFGIAYDEGFMALLPHLSPLRAGARILVLDAHRLMADGKPDEAAERIAGVYRIAAHVRNDNVLISSLVSIAVAGLAADEAEMFAKAGKLTDAGRANIVAALQPLNRADGFNCKSCMDMERRLTIDYFHRVLKGPEAGKKLLEIGLVETTEDQKKEIAAMDEAAINKDLDTMEGFYKDALKAWDAKDYEAQLQQIEAKVTSGGYGVLAKLLLPAATKVRSSDVKAAARVSAVLRALTQPSREEAPAK